ncbi:hypothetical protein NMT12_60073 [metagenome]
MAKNDKCSNTRDAEFKMCISTEDIDHIVQQIKNLEIDSKSFDEFNVINEDDEK